MSNNFVPGSSTDLLRNTQRHFRNITPEFIPAPEHKAHVHSIKYLDHGFLGIYPQAHSPHPSAIGVKKNPFIEGLANYRDFMQYRFTVNKKNIIPSLVVLFAIPTFFYVSITDSIDSVTKAQFASDERQGTLNKFSYVEKQWAHSKDNPSEKQFPKVIVDYGK